MKDNSADQSRRRFLNWFLGTSVGALCLSIAYPVIRYLTPPEATSEPATNEVEAGKTNDPELLEKGYKIVRFGPEAGYPDPRVAGRPAGLRRHVHAPRLHRRVQEAKQRIWCNCHNGEYNLHGEVVAGPPPRPLSPTRCTSSRSRAGRADGRGLRRAA